MLMRSHVVVPKPEFSERIVQRLEACHLLLIELPLEGSEQPLDAPVLPWTTRIAALLADARQQQHRAEGTRVHYAKTACCFADGASLEIKRD